MCVNDRHFVCVCVCVCANETVCVSGVCCEACVCACD